DRLERVVGAKRLLADCTGRSGWPERGVYFFFESGEFRSDSGKGPRTVRVGTHALTPDAGTRLWGRLRQHRGTSSSGGGNHRGSVFRDLVGASLAARDPAIVVPSWNTDKPQHEVALAAEHEHERRVSAVIRSMPFPWVAIPDAASYGQRGYVETNAIALLSNYTRPAVDAPSPSWLGRHCDRALVRDSGLWNNDDVKKTHDAAFLRAFEALIAAMERA